MILNICSSADILKVLRIVKIIIVAITIIVPILLVFSLSKDFMQSISTGELQKELKKSVTKFIAAVCIFLVPTFINIILNLVGGDGGLANCLDNATPEGIMKAYNVSAQESVDYAKESLTEADYTIALNKVNKLEDETTKNELIKELNTIRTYVDISNAISQLETNYNRTLYNEVKNSINNLSASLEKEKLLARFNKIYHYEKTNVVEESSSKRYHINGYTGIKYYLYNQCEGSWSNTPLGGDRTFCDVGCGLTTCTVIISSYNNSVTPNDSRRFGNDYHHDEVIEKETNNSYDCTKYDKGKISKEEIIANLEKGNVISVKVWGSSKGGSSKFTGSQHFMALIDYYEGEIFVGNAYGSSGRAKYGWYNADEVLTSVMSTVVCVPNESLMR